MATLVASSVNFTVAPGTTAPEGSVTVPVMVARVESWAAKGILPAERISRSVSRAATSVAGLARKKVRRIGRPRKFKCDIISNQQQTLVPS